MKKIRKGIENTVNFLKEFYHRFTSATPRFNRILSKIGVIIAAIGSIPSVFNDFQAKTGAILPTEVWDITNKMVFVCGIITWFVARLATKTIEPSKMPITVDPDKTPPRIE